ncbi:MAG: hypothetical protein GF344_04235 [Chitinivibrionales bacterium]|nr:hypothetical protein [Chitinivibrionales bacterium]MBD3356253.1 hypothetical protein [Chitinivibrionales bacterium]
MAIVLKSFIRVGRVGAAIVLSASAFLHAATHADYLIVENPAALSVLDAYEQTLDATARKRLLPFSPLRIVKRRAVLGDRITEAMICEYRGDTYYLLRDEAGKLIGLEQGGYHKEFKGARVLGDTVRIEREKTVLLSRRYPQSGDREYVPAGTIAIKIFAYGTSYYIRLLGRESRYGWCSKASSHGWKRLENNREEHSIALSAELADRIVGRVRAANESYAAFFAHFNEVTGANREPPRWKHERKESELRFDIIGGIESGRRLEHSTNVLIGDIRNLLLGKSFTIERRETTLIIKPGNQ